MKWHGVLLCVPCFIAELLLYYLQEFIDLEMDAYRNNVIRVRVAFYTDVCKFAVYDCNILHLNCTETCQPANLHIASACVRREILRLSLQMAGHIT